MQLLSAGILKCGCVFINPFNPKVKKVGKVKGRKYSENEFFRIVGQMFTRAILSENALHTYRI